MFLVILYALARLTFDASYVDPHDGVSCDVYRVGRYELNACTYSEAP